MIDRQVLKNTVFLYGRMLVLIFVSLYTTRLLLEYLGVIDFGVYSLVWGVVLLLGFFNNSITGSVQRFLNVNIGLNNLNKLKEIYSVSLVMFIFLGVLLSVFLLFLKDIVFFNFLKIPDAKLSVANEIYNLMVGSFFVGFLSLHFHSCIISMERFSFYAFITIFESVLKLISVLLLFYVGDRLYFYSLFLLVSNVIVFLILYLYCKFNVYFSRFNFVANVDSYRELLSFISWSVFGGFGVVVSAQGVPLIANFFYGVVINGSLSIASQVNALIGVVTNNFQKAFTPYLMRSFVSRDNIDMKIFILTKLSVVFYSIVAIPLFFYTQDFLLLWLIEIPIYVEKIVKISAVISFFEVLAGPLWVIIQAEGNIRNYQISVLLVMAFSLPFTYLLLDNGFDIYHVWYMLFSLNMILFFVRIYFVNRLISNGFILAYIKQIIIPVVCFLGVCFFVTNWLRLFNHDSFLSLIILNFAGVLFYFLIAYIFLLNRYQRKDVGKLFVDFKDKIFTR